MEISRIIREPDGVSKYQLAKTEWKSLLRPNKSKEAKRRKRRPRTNHHKKSKTIKGFANLSKKPTMKHAFALLRTEQ